MEIDLRNKPLKKRLSVTRLILTIFVLCSWFSIDSHAAADSKFHFSIPEKSTDQSLLDIGQQSGSTIVFRANEIFNFRSPEVSGTYSILQAIELALSYCRCQVNRAGDNSYIIDVNQPEQRETTTPSLEEVRVTGYKKTGSNLIRKGSYNNSFLVSLDAHQIESTSSSSLHDILKNNPLVTGETSSTAVNSGGNGTATVSLRGLPADTTLVLLDGMRIAPNSLSSQLVDLYSLPSFATQKIEIFKDGTSAIYGSDAIAGTVNVILEKEADQFTLAQFHGITSRHDLETHTLTLSGGKQFGSLDTYFAASYFQQNGIFSRDRNISSDANSLAIGGVNRRSVTTPNSTIFFPDGLILIAENTVDDITAYRQPNLNDLYNYQQDSHSYSPAKRYGVYSNTNWTSDAKLSASLFFFFTHSENRTQYSASPMSLSMLGDDAAVAIDNIYNPFGIKLNHVTRRMTELSYREKINRNLNNLMGAKLESAHNNYQWETSFHISNSLNKSVNTNLIDAQKLTRGIGTSSNCQGNQIDGCTPINILGAPGSIDQEQADYIRANSEISGNSQVQAFSYKFGSDLENKTELPVLFSTGFEWRKEATERNPDNGNHVGYSAGSQLKGERYIKEYFGEMEYSKNIIGDDLKSTLELAARRSDYSDFGESISPRTSFKLQILKKISLKSSYSESFHAPSLQELHSEGSGGYYNIIDPCMIPENVSLLAGCTLLAPPTSQQVLVKTPGNPSLEAEKAKSYSSGIHWGDEETDTFIIGIDYFRIHQRNVIHLIHPEYLIYRQAIYGDTDYVQRDEFGSITQVTTSFSNTGVRELSGYDIKIAWKKHLNELTKSFQLNATYIDKYQVATSEDTPSSDISGRFIDVNNSGHGALPSWKVNTSISVDYKNFQVSYSNAFINEMKEFSSTSGPRTIKSWTTHNIQFKQAFYTQRLKLRVGIDNLLDTPPPFSSSSYYDNYDARTHDLRGRFIYTRINFDF